MWKFVQTQHLSNDHCTPNCLLSILGSQVGIWSCPHLNWSLPLTCSSPIFISINRKWQLCSSSCHLKNFGVILNSFQSLTHHNQMNDRSWSRIWPLITSTSNTLIQAIISSWSIPITYSLVPESMTVPLLSIVSTASREILIKRSQIMSLFCSNLSNGFPCQRTKKIISMTYKICNSPFSQVSAGWLPDLSPSSTQALPFQWAPPEGPTSNWKPLTTPCTGLSLHHPTTNASTCLWSFSQA